jgi:hypothetical protein
MPDTPKNQAEYPQQKAQKPGVGFPIARAVAIVSLATACVMDVAIGPYSGKETGESALLRSMLEMLSPGDIAVMDRYYCSFMMIALLLSRGTHTFARSVRSGWMKKRMRGFPRHFNCVRSVTTSSSAADAPSPST